MLPVAVACAGELCSVLPACTAAGLRFEWLGCLGASRMSQRHRIWLQVLVAVVALLLADQTARWFALTRAAGLLCLTSLGALVICARLGWRQALLGVVGLALLTIPAALSQRDPFMATVVLMLTAFVLGVSARWQLQQVYWLLIVSLCLLITNSPLPVAPQALDLARLAGGVLVGGGLAILLQSWLLPREPATLAPSLFPVAHSWRRSVAYGGLLASTTLVSTPIAMQNHWHLTGLWLILTPFLVLRPFVRDAWRVALHRCLGTLAGVLLVMLLAVVWPQDLPLPLLAIVLGVTTVLIAIRRAHPALLVMALTATVVLFNSNSTDLTGMADRRLLASALGIGIALAVMAVAHPIERHWLLHRPIDAGKPSGGT